MGVGAGLLQEELQGSADGWACVGIKELFLLQLDFGENYQERARAAGRVLGQGAQGPPFREPLLAHRRGLELRLSRFPSDSDAYVVNRNVLTSCGGPGGRAPLLLSLDYYHREQESGAGIPAVSPPVIPAVPR